jgi:hypothetical protein
MQQPGILQPAEPDSLSIGHRRFTETDRRMPQARNMQPRPAAPPRPALRSCCAYAGKTTAPRPTSLYSLRTATAAQRAQRK